jgi:urocanate hydratase
MGGVARRAWARNPPAIETVIEWNKANQGTGQITLPHIPPEGLVEEIVKKRLEE